MDARDFFESVRAAAMEEERTRRQIERMRLREGIRGGGFSSCPGGGRKDVNGMSATDSRIDYETMMGERLRSDRETIDRGMMLLYGLDGDGGVSKLLGSAVADAVAMRYVKCQSWAAVGDMCCASASTVKRWCDTAMDTIDSHGIDRLLCGTGVAEG